MGVILKIENISKQYRLGLVGTGTISHDLNRFWAKIRGKEDPYLKVGAVNKRDTKAKEDYVWALQDINFEVQQGEVLGIIGKNGAGKSTLLKILSRVTSPTTGAIKTKGRIASLLEVGTGFHPELTGRENVFLNGAILGMTKAEITDKIDEIVEFSGCELYIDTPVKRYSSGMRVRLAFAVAAHLEPDILVVDEVLAVGDAEFQKKAIGKMQDISKSEGRTVLFVSHNMVAVSNLCTRALVLINGEVCFEGETEKAIRFYLQSNNQLKGIPLLKRKDRFGNENILMSNVELLDESLTPIAEVISGKTLILKISIKENKKINYNILSVAINFRDNFEKNILSFITDEMGVNFSPLQSQNYFYLKIPRLFLRGGVYFLRIMLFEGKTKEENLLDKVEKILEINVISGDIWESGIVNRSDNAAVIPAEFIFDDN